MKDTLAQSGARFELTLGTYYYVKYLTQFSAYNRKLIQELPKPTSYLFLSPREVA